MGDDGGGSRTRARRSPWGWLVRRASTSGTQLRLTFEGAPIGMALVAVDGRFLRVNPAFCALVGYEQHEVTAITFQDLTHPDDLHADLELVAACLAGHRERYAMEKRYRHRDGHHVWVELNVALVRDRAGRPRHFVSQVLDIAERRAHAARLAASEARFAALVEHGSDLISVTDPAGRLVYASPAYLTVLGFDPRDRVGEPMEDYIHPDDRERVVERGASLLSRPGASATLDFRYAHADGSWRWVEATLTNRLDDPAVGGFVANTRDVTDRVVAAERLAHQATHDVLTGLPNRMALEDRLTAARAGAAERGELLAVLFVDVDHFKWVNDTHGHGIGDLLLAEVGARLRRGARSEDMVIRVGGDEFIIIAGVRDEAASTQLAARVCEAFTRPFLLDGRELAITASVGVATTSDVPGDLDLIEAADRALYEAKAAGRDGWVAYLPQMRRQGLARAAEAPAPQELADRYRAQLGASSQAILVHVQGHIVAASPAAVALFGFEGPEDLAGREIGSLAAPAHAPTARARLRAVETGEWPQPEVLQVRTATGAVISVEVSSSPAFWEGCLASQVTLRVVEDRWAEVVRIGQEMTASIAQAAVITDLDNVVVAWNDEAARVYGLRREDVLGRRLDEVLPWEGTSAERDLARQELATYGRWEGTVRQRGHDGQLVVADAVSRVIHDRDGTPVGMVSVTVPSGPTAPLDARELAVLDELALAITSGELVMAYQPIVDRSGAVVKVEALVRWEHPTRGLLLPGDFIPVAERSPMVGPLTAEVLRQSCAQVAEWRCHGHPGLELAVNISGRELADPSLVHRVRAALDSSGLPAEALWIEITETAVAIDPERACRAVADLGALGVRVALDDFGTGFATLAQLRRFPAQALKVDRMFVDGIATAEGDAAIVRSVLALGRELDMIVIAEGVETEDQRRVLAAMGCELFQGYLFARPAFAAPAPEWIERLAPAIGA